MIQTTRQKLEAARQTFEKLQRELESERKGMLARLPAELGYSSAEELIHNLRGLDTSLPETPKTATHRNRISPMTRRSIIAGIKRGMTIEETARKFGVSTASVSTIKKQAGLTQKQVLVATSPGAASASG